MTIPRWFHLGRLRYFGASLHVHISVVVATAVLAVLATSYPVDAAVTLFSLLGVILIHELGHAIVARYLGYPVEAIWLALIHGRCEVQSAEYEWDEVLIAWGGVAAQLLIAIPLCIIDSLWKGAIGVLGPVILVLGYWSLLQVGFNLLPLHGLDGEVAWRIVPLLRARMNARGVVRSALKRGRRKR